MKLDLQRDWFESNLPDEAWEVGACNPAQILDKSQESDDSGVSREEAFVEVIPTILDLLQSIREEYLAEYKGLLAAQEKAMSDLHARYAAAVQVAVDNIGKYAEACDSLRTAERQGDRNRNERRTDNAGEQRILTEVREMLAAHCPRRAK